ncbi:MAG: TerB family tellurite resistance protein [Deltaproteobacteria bacterium]|nr:TerB family tellurite resistance protein [Deltaproteobacteria bacterium]
MLELFRRIFNQNEESLTSKEDRQEKLEIATCVILLEAATADSEFSEEELQRIISLLKVMFQMTDSSVNELIETSKRERENSPGLWHFTNLINENLSIDEKYELMEMAWRVIYSDGTLDRFENYIAHKLLNLLNLDHSKFIELKLKVRNNSS